MVAPHDLAGVARTAGRRVPGPLALAVAALIAAAAPAAAAPGPRTCSDKFLLGGTFTDVIVAPGSWCLIGAATITGDLRATGATSVGVFMGTSIDGNVTISGTTSYPTATGETFGGSANAICTTTIGGDVTIQESGTNAPWNLGSTNYPPFVDFSNCVFSNRIGGTVRFLRNHAPANAIGGNEIGGDLTCEGNKDFVRGALAPDRPNIVKGTDHGRCAAGQTTPDTAAVAPSPAAHDCRSRRRITIRLDRRLTSAKVLVESRPRPFHARVLTGRRLRAIVDMRGLAAQRVVVVVAGRTRKGARLLERRVYRTCAGRG